MSKALEAAFNAVMGATDMPDDTGSEYDRWIFEASISAYLSALAEDEETVERVARALCEAEGLRWEDQFSLRSSNGDPDAHEAYKHSARAALRALKESKP